MFGDVAQLGERYHGMIEVESSILSISTKNFMKMTDTEFGRRWPDITIILDCGGIFERNDTIFGRSAGIPRIDDI